MRKEQQMVWVKMGKLILFFFVGIFMIGIVSAVCSIGSTNIALVGTATQSSTDYSMPASNAIDNNLSSFQHTRQDNVGEWWQVDLGSAKNLGRFELVRRADCCPSRPDTYRIEVSSTGAFAGEQIAVVNQDATSCGVDGCTMTHDITPISGRYVRVVNSWPASGVDPAFVNMGEFRVFETTCTSSCSEDMISYWNFDDGTANDFLGRNDGINTGASSVVGKVGNALDFNGAGDYINVGNMHSSIGGSGLSVGGWIYPEENKTSIILGNTESGNAELSLQMSGLYIWCYMYIIDGVDTGWKYHFIGAYSVNEWKHIMCTYNGTHTKGYVNGLPNGLPKYQTPNGVVGLENNENTMKIGGQTSASYFNGLIDEIVVFNKGLNDAEVQELYDKSIAGLGYCEELPIQTISACGVISSSGTWELDTDLIYTGTCFNITADDVVLDLGGHTVTGSNTNYYGVYTKETNNVTIKSGRIENFSSGVILEGGADHIIDNIVAEGNDYGINLKNTTRSTLTNNNMSGNGFNFYLEAYSGERGDPKIFDHDIDLTNTVDYSYKVYYSQGLSNFVFDSTSASDAGMIACINCNDITIRDLNLSRKNSHGILFYNTNDSLVDNIISNGNVYGVTAINSNNNEISNIIANGNYWYGILVTGVSGNWGDKDRSKNYILTNISTEYNTKGVVLFAVTNISLTNSIVNYNYWDGVYSYVSYGVFDNLSLIGDVWPEEQENGMSLYETDNSILKNIYIEGSYSRGIVIDDDAINLTLKNMTIVNSRESSVAMRIAEAPNLILENINVSNNFGDGVQLYDSENVSIKNMDVNNNGEAGLQTWWLPNSRWENINVNNNGLLYGWVGFYVGDIVNGTFINLNVSGNLESEGLWIDGGWNNTFTDVVANNNEYKGIWVDADNNTFTNVRSSNNGLQGLFTDSLSVGNIFTDSTFCYNTIVDVNCTVGQKLFSNNFCDSGASTCGGVCTGCEFSVPGASWRSIAGQLITRADIGDTVKLFLTVASSGDFMIKEKDAVFDNDIRTITGVPELTNLVAYWTITQEDLDNADDYDRFYFDVNVETSGFLNISTTYNDNPMDITIVSPACGQSFDEGDVVSIVITANDLDDVIEGNVSINGVVIPEGSFKNGGISFDYAFDVAGNFQIIAEAVNSRGKRSRDISNVMIINVPYVNGEKYVAACIDYPENYDTMEGSLVNFSAESTRAVEIVGGAKDVILPGSARFSWYWRFIAPNGQVDDIIKEFVADDTSLSYRFNVQFPVAGDNAAILQVNFD